MNLTLIDAFGRSGAKPGNKHGALWAIAADGAMVLNGEQACSRHPERGVLRYENRVSTDPLALKDAQLLGQHLALARDGALPVRMVVTFFIDGESTSELRLQCTPICHFDTLPQLRRSDAACRAFASCAALADGRGIRAPRTLSHPWP